MGSVKEVESPKKVDSGSRGHLFVFYISYVGTFGDIF